MHAATHEEPQSAVLRDGPYFMHMEYYYGAAAAGAAVVDLSRRGGVCLLCQQQFNSAETLQRHIDFSSLHLDNLAQQQHQQQQPPPDLPDLIMRVLCGNRE